MDTKAARAPKKKGKKDKNEKREQKKVEMKYYKEQLDRLLTDDTREQLPFPPTLDKGQRKKLHLYAHSIGLKSRSSGTGDDRFLIVCKKNAVPYIPTGDGPTTYIRLTEESTNKIDQLLATDPITEDEKQNTILRPIENETHAHLPFMFGNSNSKAKLIVPPIVRHVPGFSESRQSLPIYEYRQGILDAINTNQVVVISGETGSGKTTQVPQYIMEDCSARQKECRIICTQPRRLAATSIATRVSEERNDMVGKSVGYQIRLDSRITATTNLILTTSGFLLRCLTGSKQGDVYKNLTHLILDEVHEREKVTDFLLIAIRDAIQTNPHLKVILMSATLDSEQFSKYFNNCPIINVPGRLYEVDILHLGDVLTKTGYRNKNMIMYMSENQGPKALRPTQNSSIVETNECSEDASQTETEAEAEICEDDVQFYDECFDECLAQADDSPFEQIFCLINDENMPVDYMHSTKGRSALGICAEKGYFDILTKLLSLGANPALKDANGKTAFEYAEENEQADCCEVLAHYVKLDPASKSLPPSYENDADMLAAALQQFTLAAYQMTNNFVAKRNEIDHELLQNVISHIHQNNPTDGSILVFLPGYEDIMTQKDKIEKEFTMHNYQLFVLHSGVNGTNSSEQSRVFDCMPSGIRKIILSTNIAETSLTINDVVYVVDAGKVKQQSYDSISESTCLTSTDISQACAKQRTGRAGRIRNGYCYRLYSLEQYQAMEKYTLPEILRVPLTEICLNAKMLAGDLSIVEFLLKALQPPSVKNICQSIELLKKINALDAHENITYLGIHLANMPVDCQLGKMILYSIVLRCLDPVLTIVSTLSVKDPFVLPLGNDGEKIDKIKREFAQNSLSDHQMLLNTYEAWSNEKRRGDFCAEHFISNGNMQMIKGVRRLIMGHLKMAGFIADDSARNPTKLNENSMKWEIVKGCLTAGLYPNVCRISTLSRHIFSKQDKKLVPHLSSTLRERRAMGQIDPNALNAQSEWLVHGEKSRISNISLIRNITVISPINLVLFAGPINLAEENVIARDDDNRVELLSDIDCDEIPDMLDDDDMLQIDDGELFGLTTDADFDGDIDSESIFVIDDWISFNADQREANLLFKLRLKFASMLSRFLQNHTAFQPKNKELRMLEVLIDVVKQEDVVEQYIKAKALEALKTNDVVFYDIGTFNPDPNPNYSFNTNRKPIPEQAPSSVIMSASYVQAIEPEHRRNKKKKKKNNNRNMKQRMPEHNTYENYPQSTMPTDLPSTSNADAQQILTQGLFNPTNFQFTAPTVLDIDIGALSLAPSTANQCITNRYFVFTVRHVGLIYDSVYQNDWKFHTPLNVMRRVARESAPAKIFLLMHVQKQSAIFTVGQFKGEHSGNYRISIDRDCQRPFKPLFPIKIREDHEMGADDGAHLYKSCLMMAKRNMFYAS